MYSICRKFSSFEELVNDFLTRDSIAIRCGDMEGNTSEVSYRDFAEMIISESFHVKAECSSVEVVRYEQTVDSLVDIFAHVLAGCDVIIADPRVPEGFNEFAAAAAEAARRAREMQRDEFGRIKGRGGEGELLFFTSGTTSSSKIVRLTSRSLCTSAWSGQCMLACGEGDLILSNLSLSHAYGFVCSMLWGLAYGATVALGRDVLRFTGDALFFKPTIIPAVPSQIADMLQKNALNPELRVVLIGGAPCPKYLSDSLKEKGLAVYLGYGLTETSSGIAITQDLDEPDAMYPCPGADIRIEEDGEISVATPCMMLGYLGREPMFEDGRFYTSDIGWFDEKG
ncbi:MAG: acyl--CoA ligase, partial [Mogibacterium sp.]|nr:acyl--CoA ligase [Mogibacterium sp.]